jgi:phosphatidylglycerol:prolipoprotein diacylglycerol transferase
VLPSAAPLPVIELAFDPIAQFGDWSVRLETLGYAAVIFLALVAAAVFARRTPLDLARPASDHDAEGEPNHLRADDLLYIAVAVIPGAVIGGRLGYVLTHLPYYQANPGGVLDIGQGAFELTMAVAGGILTGSIVARMLGTPVGRWLHAVTLPLLFALGAGKLAMVLGGSGQGLPFDGAWATAYVSPGPWGSLAPALPSHPAQAYEALATLVVLLVVMASMALGVFARLTGAAFLLGIELWAIGRALVAATWRDPDVVAGLNADQLLTIAFAAVALGALMVASGLGIARGRRAQGRPAEEVGGIASADSPEPTWPDPESRPRI